MSVAQIALQRRLQKKKKQVLPWRPPHPLSSSLPLFSALPCLTPERQGVSECKGNENADTVESATVPRYCHSHLRAVRGPLVVVVWGKLNGLHTPPRPPFPQPATTKSTSRQNITCQQTRSVLQLDAVVVACVFVAFV